MKNNRTLTPFELNIVELFERLQSAKVAEDTTFKGTFYVDYPNFIDSGCDWVTESREDLLNYCIDGINQWYSETDTKDMLNNDFILENTTDYLQLLLTLPGDTTILAVGQGCVSAPSTTTAYLHEAETGAEFLAIYDYENEEVTEQMKTDLEELFPSVKIYESSFTECFYTGGGVWCTVYQLSGDLSDYYYSLGGDETMCLYSHKADKQCNDDEFGFYGVVKYIDMATATIAEREIYNQMKAEETKTLKNHGIL